MSGAATVARVRRSAATGATTFARRLEAVPRSARRAVSVLAVFAIWWALVRFGVAGFAFFVSPVETAAAVAAHLTGEPVADGGTIYLHAAYTTARVLAGVAVAVTVAIPLGLVIGTQRRWERFLLPALEFLRPIPPIAWVPLVLVIFPTVRLGVVFVVFLGAFFPVLVNTVNGVRSVDDEYRRAAASLGAGDREVLRHVVLPSALPAIFTGVTIGVGLGWVTVIAAEMITGEYGLGHVVFQAYRLIDVESVVVGMIAVGFLGAASTALLSAAVERAAPWLEGAPTGVTR
ncbi:NitT/TauT family transport system permease protein [Halobiforma haloterrestris]|uniref:NitT/TauT family transport system permease protein n=1 Tax=Natronobacterium haloterrestre TaxID=148448 RepID=A0A1I1FH08_NATHA|nr:ABC transporter permease [Halobiforma haloterrestris]SFB98655.1 NitT/TauT family transport system permease protein [Halobiforma haloterrestris]